MERTVCPRCGGGSVLFGPVGMANPWACLACGLAWAEVDLAQLRGSIRRHGNALARQLLDEVDLGPMRGLPDTAPARQVAARLAELDHLAGGSSPNLVVRRFRDLLGVTWDEAIAATRDWQHLTRDEKLARVGWVGKKPKEPIDDLAEPLI